ncbi:MAG: GerMN domain-containing protein [Armatimonadetes bacterium]|nr:GerMN domain-containing protein [Armatimonadota bacterium]
MARETKTRKSLTPVWVALCCFAALGGLAYYVVNSPGRTVPTIPTTSPSEHAPRDVKVYTPTYDKGDLKLHPNPAKSPEKQDPRVFAVNDYLGRLSMVPKGARLVTCQISGDTATLDFSKEFDTTYGTEDEQTIVKGILTTMAQFPEVKLVRFTVAGQTLETLGNIDLTTPQPVLPEQLKSQEPAGASKPQ